MLKYIVLTAAIACAAPVMSAQTAGTQPNTRTITGMVVDKNGNPLSGAEVRATGGAETVYTEADGSYSIEVPVTLKSLTASYTGLRDTKLRTTALNQMIFTLKEHRRTHGFINLVGAGVSILGNEPKVDGILPNVGIMGGAYRSWGGYAKIVLCAGGPNISLPGQSDYYDEDWSDAPTVTLGVIKRLNPRFNLLVGIGLGVNCYVNDSGHISDRYDHGTLVPEYSYSYVERVADRDIAPAFELGVMYHYKKLNVIAGVTYLTPMNGGDNYTDSYRDYESDNVYTDYHYWTIYGKNSGNLGIFVSIGLHI